MILHKHFLYCQFLLRLLLVHPGFKPFAQDEDERTGISIIHSRYYGGHTFRIRTPNLKRTRLVAIRPVRNNLPQLSVFNLYYQVFGFLIHHGSFSLKQGFNSPSGTQSTVTMPFTCPVPPHEGHGSRSGSFFVISPWK